MGGHAYDTCSSRLFSLAMDGEALTSSSHGRSSWSMRTSYLEQWEPERVDSPKSQTARNSSLGLAHPKTSKLLAW